MVRAHSISRVYCTPGEDRANCEGLGATLQDIITAVTQSDAIPEEAQEAYWGFIHDFLDHYGYGSVGDSNSVWGCQERIIPENSRNETREDALRSAASALGFVVQELTGFAGERQLAVFAPSLDRFVGFDHPMNAPLSEAVIVEHDPYRGEAYIEVGGGRTVLDEVAAVVAPNRDERSHGVLTYDTTAMAAIESALHENDRPYSVHDSYVDNLATREWCPGLEASEYLAVKEDRGWNRTYRAHAIREDSFACGTTVSDRSEFRVLRPRTVTRLDEMTDSVAWCGHRACEKRLPSREVPLSGQ